MHHRLAQRRPGRAQQCREHADAVLASRSRKLGPNNIRAGRHQIREARQLVRLRTRLDLARPAADERNPVPAIPDVRLVPTKDIVRVMPFLFQLGNPRRRRTAVVAGEDHQRVVGNPVLLQRGHDFADAGVRLHDKVGIGTDAAFRFPFLYRHDRRVRRGQGQVDEERVPFLRFSRVRMDVLNGLARQRRQNIYGLKIRSCCSRPSPRFLGRGRLRETIVLDEGERGHIQGGGNAVVGVETPGRGPLSHFQRSGVLRDVQAHMPFADAGGGIPILYQQRGHCHPLRLYQRLIVSLQHPGLQTRSPAVAARQHAISRRRTNG